MKKIIILVILLPLVFALERPYLEKYVNDFGNVLDQKCEDKINKLSNEIEKRTTAEIVVVTMNSLCDNDICEDLEKYSNDLFRQTGIGKKDKDNGVLILIFIQDKRYRIEVGYGLEGEITDFVASDIAEKFMVPFFKQNDYCSGLYNAVFQLGQVIIGENNSTIFVIEKDSIKTETDESKTVEIIIFLIFVIFLIVFLYLIIKNPNKKRSFIFVGGGSSSSKSGGFGGGSSGGGGASGKW